MIQTTSQSITFYAFFAASRQGKAGLTVTVDVYRGAAQTVTGDAASEVGGGLYRYTLASGDTATAESYAAVFKTIDTTVDAQHVPSLWVVGPAWAQAAARSGADRVWDEPLAGHATAGTAGAVLAGASVGGGDTPVDHNTGGADNLRYVAGSPPAGVDDATVRAYLKSDYDAGVYTERGRTYTRPDGRWAVPIYLNAGLAYTLTFSKPGVYEVSRRDVTV